MSSALTVGNRPTFKLRNPPRNPNPSVNGPTENGPPENQQPPNLPPLQPTMSRSPHRKTRSS